jgi:hypothetical protein
MLLSSTLPVLLQPRRSVFTARYGLKDKCANPGTSKIRNALSEIRDDWIKKYLASVSKKTERSSICLNPSQTRQASYRTGRYAAHVPFTVSRPTPQYSRGRSRLKVTVMSTGRWPYTMHLTNPRSKDHDGVKKGDSAVMLWVNRHQAGFNILKPSGFFTYRQV